MNPRETDAAVACVPAGVPVEQRERWMELGVQIYGAVEELRELPDGYACRLPGDAATVIRAAEYITLDRLCCAFVCWELRMEPSGDLWLRIGGPPGTKELAKTTFETTSLIREDVLAAAGIHRLARRTPEQVIERYQLRE